MVAQGVHLGVFTNAPRSGALNPSPVYGNGAALQQTVEPLFQAYFSGARSADVFPEMPQKAADLLAKK